MRFVSARRRLEEAGEQVGAGLGSASPELGWMLVGGRADSGRGTRRRWIAGVPGLSGVLCYGGTRDEAIVRVQALALRVIAERLEHGEAPPELLTVSFNAA